MFTNDVVGSQVAMISVALEYIIVNVTITASWVRNCAGVWFFFLRIHIILAHTSINSDDAAFVYRRSELFNLRHRIHEVGGLHRWFITLLRPFWGNNVVVFTLRLHQTNEFLKILHKTTIIRLHFFYYKFRRDRITRLYWSYN